MDPYELAERGVPELTDWVRGLVVGSITVVDVELRGGEDAFDVPVLRVDLFLSDPVDSPDWPGWPGDDIWGLQCRVWDKVRELRLGYVLVHPRSLRSRQPPTTAEAGGQ